MEYKPVEPYIAVESNKKKSIKYENKHYKVK